MKKLILIAILILALGFTIKAGANEPISEPEKCPAGSYEIGYIDEDRKEPICKLEPTGCPYGDSIPLGPQCDKHAESHKEGSPVWDRWEPEETPVFEGK